MATPRKKVIDSDSVLQSGDFLPVAAGTSDTSYPDMPDADLLKVLAELGGEEEVHVNIYRAATEKGYKGGAYVDSVHPSVFSLEWLRETHGGGKYRIHVRNDTGIVRNSLIEIEERKRPMYAPSPPVQDFTKILETMQTGFNQLGQLIAQAAQASARPAIDPQQLRRDMMQDMAMMKELFGPTPQPQNGGEQAINMLMKGLELAREITPREGEAGTADIIMEALKTFGKPIAEAAMSRAVQAQESMPALAHAREPGEIFQQPAPAFTGEQPPQNEENMLKMYAAMLADKASQDSDPAIYAGLVVDNMPEDQLRALIDRPDLLQFLGSLSPKLVQYPEWVNEFVSVIREMLTDEELPASVQENQAGIVPDANNGGSQSA